MLLLLAQQALASSWPTCSGRQLAHYEKCVAAVETAMQLRVALCAGAGLLGVWRPCTVGFYLVLIGLQRPASSG